MKKNDEFRLEIEAVGSTGSGIGRKDGMTVFVPETAVGDIIECHIVKVKKNFAFGKVKRLLVPAPCRIPSDCGAFPRCGGCCYRHITYEEELKYKEGRVRDAIQRIGHIETEILPILGAAHTDGYRNKCQIPVGRNEKTGRIEMGFYGVNSHRIIPEMNCRLQPPVFTEVLGAVKKWMKIHHVNPYDEKNHSGLLRHIYIRQGFSTGELLVCLVINGDSIPAERALTDALKKIKGFRTLTINENRKRTNVILGDRTITLYGDGFIKERLLGCEFRISPESFFQVNSEQAEVLYRKAAEFASLTEKDTLFDLYCGTGTIGLTMAGSVKKLYGIEIVPEAVKDAEINAELNGTENAEFICGDAAEAAERLLKEGVTADVLLVDPPRKGLSEEMVKTAVSFNPKRIVYVSCDPATLARDLERFKHLGYVTEKIQPVDLFPRTAHVENVALLSEAEGKK